MPNPPRKKKSRPSSSEGDATSPNLRLQRVLASAGFGSRRKCEELITEGRIDIDGKNVTELGTRVDPRASKIKVDGVLIKQPKLVYFALNKPVGIVTTNRDPQGRPRVIDLINERERVFPVGRLDRNSEGLILMTNDGELSEVLAHPRHGVRKTYMVTVAGIVQVDTIKQMREGIHFSEGRFQVDEVHIRRNRGKATELEIVLREGKNREIRRILARLGHKVVQLKRTAIGSLKLGDIPTGAYRPLNSKEIKKLRDEVTASKSEDGAQPARAKKIASRKPAGPQKANSAKTGHPSHTKSAGRKRSSSDIIIKTESSGTTSGTVIGAPAESKPPERNKPRSTGGRATKKTQSRSGGSARNKKRG